MRTRRRHRLLALALLAAPSAGGLVQAADSCGLSVTGVNFGVYDPTAGSAANSTGTLTVNCSWTPAAPAQINVSVYFSTGSSNSYTTRTMTNGTSTLNYNLYFLANGTEIWGNGTGGSYYGVATIVTGTPSGSSSVTGTIYGIAPAAQDVAPGSYSDSIIVTVDF